MLLHSVFRKRDQLLVVCSVQGSKEAVRLAVHSGQSRAGLLVLLDCQRIASEKLADPQKTKGDHELIKPFVFKVLLSLHQVTNLFCQSLNFCLHF